MLNHILKSSILLCTSFLLSCSSFKDLTKVEKECNIDNLLTTTNSFSSNLTIDYQAFIHKFDKTIKGKIKVSDDKIFINGIYSNLGIEVFRVLLQSDSIVYIDRLSKKYYSGKLKDFPLYHDFHFILSNTNSLLCSRYKPLNIKEITTLETCKYVERVNNFSIFFETNNDGLLKEFSISEGSHKYSILYSIPSKKHEINKELSVYNKEIKLLDVKYTNIGRIKNDDFNIRIPKNYSRL